MRGKIWEKAFTAKRAGRPTEAYTKSTHTIIIEIHCAYETSLGLMRLRQPLKLMCGLALVVLLCVFVLRSWTVWAQRSGPTDGNAKEKAGELYRKIRILEDLDRGDIKAVRQKLNEDSMVLVVQILQGVEFSTNKDILYGQPGLRAAAKYWGKKDCLPIRLL
jgi:hypothetical protein